MKILVFVSLLALSGLHCGDAVRHSLQYFYTGSSGVPNFPEFVVVGMLDEVPFSHYDSNTEKTIPKQDWMEEVTTLNPQYWDRENGNLRASQQWFKPNIEIAKQRFNQTGGVHIFQFQYGCEWDDETGEVNVFRQHGFDGEDFISFDLKTGTFVAARQQAVITKHKWDNNEAMIANLRNYYTKLCPDWGKKYLELGRSSLLRTELPSVSFLQKTPSSAVSCHATGFYPGRAALMWTKDGVELHEEVERGEILPNEDGSFQLSAELNLESVQAEDWRRYQCVFQLAGEKDMATTLHKDKIKTNRDASTDKTVTIIIVAVCVLALVLVVTAVVIYRVKKAKHQPSRQSIKSPKELSRSTSVDQWVLLDQRYFSYIQCVQHR